MKIANKLFLTVLSFFSMIIGADGLNSFAKKPVIEVKAKENIAIALKEGEAKAEKTCAIKIAGIKKDAEWQDEIAKREIASLKAALKAKEEEAAELRSKLDNAYTRIQEMAIEQSKASTPRLVETTK